MELSQSELDYERRKIVGTDLFKAGRYAEALQAFEEASRSAEDKGDATVYSNASLCCLRLQQWEQAVEYASEALRLLRGQDHLLQRERALFQIKDQNRDQTERIVEGQEASRNGILAKVLYRRATAYDALGLPASALGDWERAANLLPDDQSIQRGLKTCQRVATAERFARAIRQPRFDLTRPHIRSIEVEPSYDGWRIDDDQAWTLDVVLQLAEYLKSERRVHRRFLYRILLDAKAIFEQEPNFPSVSIPPDNAPSTDIKEEDDGLNAKKDDVKGREGRVTVCGDVHGQFFDLLRILDLSGWPDAGHTYIFNGDFVDRGAHSLETITLLLALKCCWPGNFFPSRGNHEIPSCNRTNSFFAECRAKYSAPGDTADYVQVWEMFSRVFNTLPIGYVVHGSYLVVHGGLPAQIDDYPTISALNERIDRFGAPDNASVVSQFLWSDPQTDPTQTADFTPSPRGEGVLFHERVTARTLARWGLRRILRSHVWEPTGFAEHHGGQCVTIFSAPNYTGPPSPGAWIDLLLRNLPEDRLDVVRFEAAPWQGRAAKPRPHVPLLF